jgi:ADP-heptose:LPS heptosyltransferase
MEPDHAFAEFRRPAQPGTLTPEEARRLAEDTAAAFLAYFSGSGGYRGEAIALLTELATSEDPALARAGVHGLFPCLVEQLGDAFDPAACALYDRLFVQVIQHCRRLPAGAALDAELRRFGLATERDILARAACIRAPKRMNREQGCRLKRAFVLSRVTIGADVAVTSVVLAALKRFCPQAQLTLVANPKVQQLFAGDASVSLCALEYARGGGLFDRLDSWLKAIEVVRRETAGLQASEYLVIDPDSRLTQLGLLPLLHDESAYAFFESRSYRAGHLQKISELTAHWLQRLCGMDLPIYPYCAPSPADVALARQVVGAARARSTGPVVSLNLGVGANPRKRLPDPFEYRLLERLLQEGVTVILDKGGEPEEAARIEALRLACAAKGYGTVALSEASADLDHLVSTPDPRLLTWQGGIGRLAALIGQSDLYVGYDSAGQHIAAALGVPTVDIFTGFSSPRMPQRWAPHGPGPVHLLMLKEAEKENPARLQTLVDEVIGRVKLAGRCKPVRPLPPEPSPPKA